MPISTNLYLDTRFTKEQGKNAEYPIKLSITKGGRTAYLPTGIFVSPLNWKDRRIIGRKDKARLNDFLLSFQSRARDIINEGRLQGRYIDCDATDVKNDVAEQMGKEPKRSASVHFMDIFDRFAETRKTERTKEIYRVTGRKIRQLFPMAERIAITAIDWEWLEDFDERLISLGNNPSTRNLDFRNIRAVVRYAIKRKLIKENPFEDFQIPEGVSPNRALSIEQLRTFMNAPLAPWEEKYRDFFMLSFYLIGINTEDLLHLEAIEDGRINYIRAKTHKPISVKVEDAARVLFDKYKGERFLLNVLDTYSSTHNWTTKVDATLKSIAFRNGLPPITMYWARHTWATIAHGDLGISVGTIADALGHQSDHKVTHIYIRKKDYSVVDEANKKVIKYLAEVIITDEKDT